MSWFNRAPRVTAPSSAKLGDRDVSPQILQKLATGIQGLAADKETRGLTPEQFLGMRIFNHVVQLIAAVTDQIPGGNVKDSKYYADARAIVDPMIARANGLDLAEVQKTEPFSPYA